MEDSSDLPSDPAELQTVIEDTEAQIASLQEKINEESCKMERYKVSCRVKPLDQEYALTNKHLGGIENAVYSEDII